jgi:hypothetical protein
MSTLQSMTSVLRSHRAPIVWYTGPADLPLGRYILDDAETLFRRLAVRPNTVSKEALELVAIIRIE